MMARGNALSRAGILAILCCALPPLLAQPQEAPDESALIELLRTEAANYEHGNGVAQDGRLLGQARRPVEVDEQRQARLAVRLARPAHNELLGVGIEVPFAERRGVDGVEELLQFRDVDLDELALDRDGTVSTPFTTFRTKMPPPPAPASCAELAVIVLLRTSRLP